MTGAPYRQDAYEAKVKPARLLADLTALLPEMTQRVEAVFPMITAMELAVKQVLDGSGIATIQYPFYLDFGRELFKKGKQEISGESLAQFAAVLIAKWVARGLTSSVLAAVRTQVFNVGVPMMP